MFVKLDNRAFTLVEMLAVVVILGVLSVIMVPTVTTLISKNRNDNYKNLEQSIISAANMYMSDNRYSIVLEDGVCTNNWRNIVKIGDTGINDSKLSVSAFVDYLSSDNILNPKDDKKHLDIENSFVLIKYNCSNKDYDFIDFDESCGDGKSCLKWEE